MNGLLTLLLVVSCVVAFRYGGRWRAKLSAEQRRALEAGRLQHRRTGDYPSSCTWCRNTTLARKLLMFERVHGEWKSRDVMGRLKHCGEADVDAYASVLVRDEPKWRRFCTEKCTREFMAVERVESVEAFTGCEYCSVRFPMALVNCPNCGAARAVA